MISFSNQIERRKHFILFIFFFWVTNLSARHEGKKILDPVAFHLFLSLSAFSFPSLYFFNLVSFSFQFLFFISFGLEEKKKSRRRRRRKRRKTTDSLGIRNIHIKEKS
jgi:4-amino-4-deoxy-L-arabinose transferase-like glycosyltransferase